MYVGINMYNPFSHESVYKRAINNISKMHRFSNYKFASFGYESRHSAGWDTSPYIATGYFGRIGVSSYLTNSEGNRGMFYCFSGVTNDIMNWEGTTSYYGLGINIYDSFILEVQIENIGVGSQIAICDSFIGIDVNLIGGTSITIGHNENLGNGQTYTYAFTIGVNTGFLLAVLAWITNFVKNGDPSLLPVLNSGY